MISLLGVFGQGADRDAVLQIVADPLPASAADTSPDDRATGRGSSAGLALVIGDRRRLWSASGYVGAFGRAMNRDLRDRRGPASLETAPAAARAHPLPVCPGGRRRLHARGERTGRRAVGDAIGLGVAAVTVWSIAKWPVIAASWSSLFVAILYYATPNVKQPKFRWMSVGASMAIIDWIGASLLFGIYVANFGSYNKTYGALAGVIVFLLWLWITNLALLFGAELDS